MNNIGLKFISNEVKKQAKAAIGISKKVIKTCLKLQYNVAISPFYFMYGGFTYVFKKFFISDRNDQTAEPKSEDLVRATKKLQISAISGMRAISSPRCYKEANRVALKDSVNKDKLIKPEYKVPYLNLDSCSASRSRDINPRVAFLELSDFSGSKLMWDVPIISSKASYFAHSLEEKTSDHIEAARKALKEYSASNPLPDTRQEYNEAIEKARNDQKYAVKSFVKTFKGTEPLNVGKCNADNAVVDSYVFEKSKQETELNVKSNKHSPKHKTKLSCNPFMLKNKFMYREIAEINTTLKKIQVTCARLLGGLANLNDGLLKVISMKEKLTSLEFQVDEGKRLLQEVESDRFIMKTKLSALEKLINEEEKFLCGDFCESGFYESENVDSQ